MNWNGRHFLEKYLPSVLYSVRDNPDARIVVADNGSDDGSLELLAAEFPGVQVIALDRNYGFTEGYNRALACLDDDLFVLLNSDVEVPDGWLEPLVEWMELHKDCGICGPKLHMTTDRDSFEYAGAAGGYLDRHGYPFCRGRVLKRVEKDRGQYDIPAEVLWVSGAALMVRRELYTHLGGLCAEFFAHMEEIDFCWRARLDGWKVNVVPRSTVYHLGGGSLPQDSPRKLYLNYRNNLLMLSRNLPATFALDIAFNLVGKTLVPDEAPDLTEACIADFNDFDRSLRKDIVSTAVDVAMSMSSYNILFRMCLDALSAMVYLITGRFSSFKAVYRAHSDYRKMRKPVSRKKLRAMVGTVLRGERRDIADCMLTAEVDGDNLMKSTFSLKGMWDKWVVWQSIIKKNDIFESIKDRII